jgi:hypothetical protein
MFMGGKEAALGKKGGNHSGWFNWLQKKTDKPEMKPSQDNLWASSGTYLRREPVTTCVPTKVNAFVRV